MGNAKKIQRPRHRQQHVKKAERVANHGAPLRQKRRATIAVGIPQRDFTVPKTITVIGGRGNREHAKVAIIKGLPSQKNWEKSADKEESEQKREILGGKENHRGFRLTISPSWNP